MRIEGRVAIVTDWVVYLRYVSCGGVAEPLDVKVHLAGLVPLRDLELAILEHAVWELEEGL